jgi:hypothetical protein
VESNATKIAYFRRAFSLIACVDGLGGLSDAIHAVFPETDVQRCIIHQIRHSLRYVAWGDRKEFTKDLRRIYQAPTREQAESRLLQLGEKWGQQYASAVRSWENNWEELATMFAYPTQIRPDLHHELGGGISSPTAQGGQVQGQFRLSPGRAQATLSGQRKRDREMVGTHSGLGEDTQSVDHSL